MWRYIIKRILASIPVVIIVGVITFSLLYIAPGDPAAIIGGDEANPEILEQIRKDLGFDRPYHVQLGNWFWNMLRGDLGTSIFSKKEITEVDPAETPADAVPRDPGDGHLLDTRRGDRYVVGVALRQQSGPDSYVLRRAGIRNARLLAGVHHDLGVRSKPWLVPGTWLFAPGRRHSETPSQHVSASGRKQHPGVRVHFTHHPVRDARRHARGLHPDGPRQRSVGPGGIRPPRHETFRRSGGHGNRRSHRRTGHRVRVDRNDLRNTGARTDAGRRNSPPGLPDHPGPADGGCDCGSSS